MFSQYTTWRLAAAVIGLACAAHAGDAPENPDFEQGELGETPPGWFCPTAGFTATLTDGKPRAGKMCAHLAPLADAEEAAPFGNIMQSFDATVYRAKRIRVSAAVRVKSAGIGDRAQMWVREDTAAGEMGFFDNMGDRPIRGADWKTVAIVGNITTDAARLNIGLITFGKAEAWLDDVKIEVLGEVSEATFEPPRPLSERGLANLAAFTKLFGLVRHFHPSDAAAQTDWEVFAIDGVRRIESAKGAADLAAKLTELFQPIALTVRVYPSDAEPAPPPSAMPEPASGDELQVAIWEHRGFGAGNMPPYHSQRLRADIDNDKIPDGFRDPRKPFATDLGGGVSCSVPLAVFADETGTLPHGSAPAADESELASEPSGNDRATRLAAVALAWNVFEHFYPYFDVVETDWDQVLVDALKRAATDKDERAFLDTLRLMVAALHDGHGRVNHTSYREYAIPPIAVDWVEDSLVVTHASGAAGDKPANLAAGTIIRAIDGIPAAKALAEVERFISGATPQWRRYRAVGEILCGPEGSTVQLDLEDLDGQRRTITLKRDAQLGSVQPPRPGAISEIRPGIMYVDIGRITDDDFREALARLEKASGIIFDFRGYPNKLQPLAFIPHLIDKPVVSPQWHVPRITEPGHTKDKSVRGGEWHLSPRAPYLTAKRAFLTYGGAISYAESCMGIIEHYKLGEIVGGPTAGTNGNINPFTVPGGYSITWTGMKVLKQDGSQHHGVGILPTIPVAQTIEGIRAGRDEVLERAIEAVSE